MDFLRLQYVLGFCSVGVVAACSGGSNSANVVPLVDGSIPDSGHAADGSSNGSGGHAGGGGGGAAGAAGNGGAGKGGVDSGAQTDGAPPDATTKMDASPSGDGASPEASTSDAGTPGCPLFGNYSLVHNGAGCGDVSDTAPSQRVDATNCTGSIEYDSGGTLGVTGSVTFDSGGKLASTSLKVGSQDMT